MRRERRAEPHLLAGHADLAVHGQRLWQLLDLRRRTGAAAAGTAAAWRKLQVAKVQQVVNLNRRPCVLLRAVALTCSTSFSTPPLTCSTTSPSRRPPPPCLTCSTSFSTRASYTFSLELCASAWLMAILTLWSRVSRLRTHASTRREPQPAHGLVAPGHAASRRDSGKRRQAAAAQRGQRSVAPAPARHALSDKPQAQRAAGASVCLAGSSRTAGRQSVRPHGRVQRRAQAHREMVMQSFWMCGGWSAV